MGRRLASGRLYRIFTLISCAILAALLGINCVSEAEIGAVAASDAGTSDDTGEPVAILNATLPLADVTIADGDIVQVDAGAPDAYTLPENSVKTCAEFLSCMNDCPPGVGSCVGPCHDAMTVQAAADVQAFLSCASRNQCREEDCLMRRCGRELRACMR